LAHGEAFFFHLFGSLFDLVQSPALGLIVPCPNCRNIKRDRSKMQYGNSLGAPPVTDAPDAAAPIRPESPEKQLRAHRNVIGLWQAQRYRL